MDFDTLLNYCIKLNESTNEKCLVCHIPLEKNDSHLKLKCNHLFHKNCINYKKGSTKCLYCDKSSIPDVINDIILDSNITCKVILKSGPNKGQYCDRSNCKYHALNKQNVIIINSSSNKTNKTNKTNKNPLKLNKCSFVLKSGKNCGNICGRDIPCKYHKLNKTIINTNENNSDNDDIEV